MNLEQTTPWLIALVGVIGNIIQFIKGWRKGTADVDAIRQQLMVELIDKSRELSAEWEKRNKGYILRLAQEKENMLEANRRLRQEIVKLEERLGAVEDICQAQNKRITALEKENTVLKEELTYWKENGK